jgi:ribonuclease BN (tRNA processing enzyme)
MADGATVAGPTPPGRGRGYPCAMHLTVIGAGPAYTDRRGSVGASYLIRAEGGALLLDLGQGAFPNLFASIHPAALDGIVVTHLHPDHFVDLVPLRHYLKFEFETPRPVAVVAPAALSARLDGLHGVEGWAGQPLDISTLTEGVRGIGPFDVEARHVTHSADSYAVRVSVARGSGAGSASDVGTDAGTATSPSLVYSGDCGRAEDLVPLIRPGDTLLAEASFGAGPMPVADLHLTSADAARAAAAGGAASLLLTHIQMGHSRADALAAAEAVFGGPIRFAAEGDEFDI